MLEISVSFAFDFSFSFVYNFLSSSFTLAMCFLNNFLELVNSSIMSFLAVLGGVFRALLRFFGPGVPSLSCCAMKSTNR